MLGIDTAGHAKRPQSAAYAANIRFVDEGVRAASAALDAFYAHDNCTAFVFTSDHGMSDQGSHGDGQRANTETPLVCWGAGIGAPLPRHSDNDDDDDDDDDDAGTAGMGEWDERLLELHQIR